MKYLAVILSSLFLSGCLYQSVNSFDIERAVTACEGFDKVVDIRANFDGIESVKCKNHVKRITLSEVIVE